MMAQLITHDNGLVKLPMQLSLRRFLSLNLEDMFQIQSGELVSSGWDDVRSWPRKLDKLLHLETGVAVHEEDTHGPYGIQLVLRVLGKIIFGIRRA